MGDLWDFDVSIFLKIDRFEGAKPHSPLNMILGWLYDHTHDLEPGVEISSSESEIALSQEWDGRLTWNEKDVSHPFRTMILTIVTMVGWADVPDSDWGDFRRQRAVDISSFLNLCQKSHSKDTNKIFKKFHVGLKLEWGL